MTTLTREQWESKERADWWSAGQASRQQMYGTATEMMLDLAGVQSSSRVLDVAAPAKANNPPSLTTTFLIRRKKCRGGAITIRNDGYAKKVLDSRRIYQYRIKYEKV